MSCYKLLTTFLALILVLLTPQSVAAAVARSGGSSVPLVRRTALWRLVDNVLHVPDDVPDDVRINIVMNMEGF